MKYQQTSDEYKEKCQSRDLWLIQYQILHSKNTRTVLQIVKRLTNEILGGKGLTGALG